MFRRNIRHKQGNIFGFKNTLPTKLQKELYTSEEYKFYEIIFSNIREEDFACLYSEVDSRPNAPVNAMVSAIILMQRNNWTYRELFKEISFNLLTKTALGMNGIDELPFCMATIFYFQNKLSEHYNKTGENLLEKVFDNLTAKQIKELKIKTNIQRTDSLLAGSNIRNYSRLQLLVEVLQRLYRELKERDKGRFKKELEPYIGQTSEKHIYDIKATDIPHQIETIGEIYHRLYVKLKVNYSNDPVFQIFERVYREQFKIVENKVIVRPKEEVRSNSLQSPDDVEATYRNKNGRVSKGQSINVVETVNTENPIELVTDVSVQANNIDDSEVLNRRIEIIKEKTPSISELHFDGAYGSNENDKEFEKLEITPVQTGVRGPIPSVEIKIDETKSGRYKVSCPEQSALSGRSRKRYKVKFKMKICAGCSLSSECTTIKQKHSRVYYFTREDYLKKKRINSINNIPEDRKKFRSNVEATISEFSRKMHNKKLKVRGFFKTTIFAFTMAISINFGRIFRYLVDLTDNFIHFVNYSSHYVKEQFNNFINFALHFTFTLYRTFIILNTNFKPRVIVIL